eukprot:TRINITY_DN4970_c0_g1_i7.p1 TRINITY_DN4970_c0_g1~~TRINITY_DN4970_c0_g1_i7.p1  ORF type:complete len:606 (-),score=148.77 TRINITY_DN4970_c0_g1_i7:18-1835(-)
MSSFPNAGFPPVSPMAMPTFDPQMISKMFAVSTNTNPSRFVPDPTPGPPLVSRHALSHGHSKSPRHPSGLKRVQLPSRFKRFPQEGYYYCPACHSEFEATNSRGWCKNCLSVSDTHKVMLKWFCNACESSVLGNGRSSHNRSVKHLGVIKKWGLAPRSAPSSVISSPAGPDTPQSPISPTSSEPSSPATYAFSASSAISSPSSPISHYDPSSATSVSFEQMMNSSAFVFLADLTPSSTPVAYIQHPPANDTARVLFPDPYPTDVFNFEAVGMQPSTPSLHFSLDGTADLSNIAPADSSPSGVYRSLDDISQFLFEDLPTPATPQITSNNPTFNDSIPELGISSPVAVLPDYGAQYTYHLAGPTPAPPFSVSIPRLVTRTTAVAETQRTQSAANVPARPSASELGPVPAHKPQAGEDPCPPGQKEHTQPNKQTEPTHIPTLPAASSSTPSPSQPVTSSPSVVSVPPQALKEALSDLKRLRAEIERIEMMISGWVEPNASSSTSPHPVPPVSTSPPVASAPLSSSSTASLPPIVASSSSSVPSSPRDSARDAPESNSVADVTSHMLHLGVHDEKEEGEQHYNTKAEKKAARKTWRKITNLVKFINNK